MIDDINVDLIVVAAVVVGDGGGGDTARGGRDLRRANSYTTYDLFPLQNYCVVNSVRNTRL